MTEHEQERKSVTDQQISRVSGGWDGEERRGIQRNMNTARTVIEFIGAIVLAFIAFTLQGLQRDTSQALEIAQHLQVSQARTESKVDASIRRLDRLEAAQDRDGDIP